MADNRHTRVYELGHWSLTDVYPTREPSDDVLPRDLPGQERAGITHSCLFAPDDEEAKHKAKSMVDGHGIDLWGGLRFIEHFPPIDPHK